MPSSGRAWANRVPTRAVAPAVNSSAHAAARARGEPPVKGGESKRGPERERERLDERRDSASPEPGDVGQKLGPRGRSERGAHHGTDPVRADEQRAAPRPRRARRPTPHRRDEGERQQHGEEQRRDVELGEEEQLHRRPPGRAEAGGLPPEGAHPDHDVRAGQRGQGEGEDGSSRQKSHATRRCHRGRPDGHEPGRDAKGPRMGKSVDSILKRCSRVGLFLVRGSAPTTKSRCRCMARPDLRARPVILRNHVTDERMADGELLSDIGERAHPMAVRIDDALAQLDRVWSHRASQRVVGACLSSTMKMEAPGVCSDHVP
jgi:hypothetical protein